MVALRRLSRFSRRLFRRYRMEIFLAVTVLAGALANANELRVVEVRRNIPLADNDPVYKDFYIAGAGAGSLKQNLVVKAVRKVGLRDATGTQSLGEMMVPVGQLKVIFTQNNLAVAREYKLLSRSDLPMLEQSGIMSGDQIDTNGAFVDKKTAAVAKKPKAVARKTADSAPTALITVITTDGPGAVLSKTETSAVVKDAAKTLPEKKSE